MMGQSCSKKKRTAASLEGSAGQEAPSGAAVGAGAREENVVRRSDLVAKEVPDVPLTDFILGHLRAGLPKFGHKNFIVDVTAGTSVRFCELEEYTLRVASALARRGFKQGDVLYYVSYELAQLYVCKMAVWRLGGSVRGCFQAMPPAEYTRQISEVRARFVLVDADTAPLLREASAKLEWSVHMVSVGNVVLPGITPFQDMLKDDGSAFPEKVEINTREDCMIICNTSGSTGMPKGVLHSHHSAVSFLCDVLDHFPNTSYMQSMMTNGIGTFAYCLHAMCVGLTVYHIGKFQREEYFDQLMKHKPKHILIYPFVATWFARCTDELVRLREAGFLDTIWVAGWVLDPTTVDLLVQQLPAVAVRQLYAMTECFLMAFSELPKHGPPGRVQAAQYQGQLNFSSGKMLAHTEAKAVDTTSGKALAAMEVGEILIRSPSVMRGYVVDGQPGPDRSQVDEDGWFHTGDLGFFDKDGNIYIKERLTFTFKYCMQRISPSEIEGVVTEHPAVLAAGVVGLPHPQTDSQARAFVVLRPGCDATEVEIANHVAARLPTHKQLHGGVRFLPSLPINKGGKLDRLELKKIALLQVGR